MDVDVRVTVLVPVLCVPLTVVVNWLVVLIVEVPMLVDVV